MATEKWLISAWDLVEWLDNIDTENRLRLLRGKKAKFLDTKGVRHMIDTVPTVDAVEVVHGRWVDRYGGKYANPLFECSECKNRAPYKFEDDSLHIGLWLQDLTDYCPNCGAKMDGDGNG